MVPEVLLVPLYRGRREAVGTLWIVSDEEGHFHGGHVRAVTELAGFVGIALHMLEGKRRLKAALEAQETVAQEMSHRVKNAFATVGALIRISERASVTKEEMSASLSGWVKALADAHGLVRPSFGKDLGAPAVTMLADLVMLSCSHMRKGMPEPVPPSR